jgi:hypothetical protein
MRYASDAAEQTGCAIHGQENLRRPEVPAVDATPGPATDLPELEPAANEAVVKVRPTV